MASPAPLPEPAPPPTEAELAPGASPVEVLVSELLTLRRRADEHTSALRASQLAVTQLTASVATLVEQQRKRDRSINLNSFVAYLLFTVLLGGASYFMYRSRVAGLNAAPRTGDAAALAAARSQLAAHSAAADEAHRLYQLGLAGQRDAVASGLASSPHQFTLTERAALAALAQSPAAPPPDDASGAGSASSAGSAAPPPGDAPIVGGQLGAAIEAYQRGDAASATEQLRAVLAAAPSPADETTARYYLGMASAKLGDVRTAIAELRAALAGDAKRIGLVDTRYQLGLLHEQVGDQARARAAFDRFATEHPKHPLAVEARRRSAALGRPAGSAAAP
jgi:TolA-binding protein